MSEIIPKNIHTVESVPELLEALDAEDVHDRLEEEFDDLSVLTGPITKTVLEHQPGDYLWYYSHSEYEPIEMNIFELPVTTWDDVAGVPTEELPEICPACEESHHFDTIENRKDGVTYNGQDGTFHHEQTVEVRYSMVECIECGAHIVEDGELQF